MCKEITVTLFAELLETSKNELVAEAIDQGQVPIAYTCSLVPEAMLSVDRLLPLRVRAPGISGTESADIYLASTTCSYVRSILEYAMDDRYDFLEGWVFVASCDHLRRLHDNIDYLLKPKFNHILDIPHKKTPQAVDWLVEEFEALREALSEHFNLVADDRALKASISEHNEFVELLKSIGDLRKLPNPPLTGTEFQQLMLAAVTSPKRMIVDTLKQYKAEIETRKNGTDSRARLMILGGHVNDPGFVEVIESQGGLVVADRVCTGSIPGLTPVDEHKDPLVALAEHTMAKADCPRMMDFDGRLQRTLNTVVEYRVDGVIIETIKFCDTWSLEAAEVVKRLRDRDIPVLRLEREYRLSNEGQIRTRVQAFLESMGK
jgi:benzoyl-CoA reductase/2-hydroxyglutaryl-CoA dehydratase subunit BcrC/BadD/HgdB